MSFIDENRAPSTLRVHLESKTISSKRARFQKMMKKKTILSPAYIKPTQQILENV